MRQVTEATGFVPFALPDIGEAEVDAVTQVVRSGWLTTGPIVTAFEQEFARYIGGGVQALAVNSATAGLHLALEALGVGQGDEVIVPTWTFTATAEVVRYLGADPILVDVDRKTLNLDIDAAAAAVTGRTKAIVPVHFGGLAVDRQRLAALARDHDLAVVEDAAHALPSTSRGQMVGSGASDAVIFSFYATKTMTTGEGGMIVTRRPELAERVKTMRLHGINRDVFDRYRSSKPSWRYEVVAPGFKYNLTDIAAAIGRVQLRRVDAMRDRRSEIAAEYDAGFDGLPLGRPAGAPDGDLHAWHLYVLRIQDGCGISRDAFIARVGAAGVGCSVHFIPLHRHPYWRDRYGLSDRGFAIASHEFDRVVSLPLYSAMSPAQVDKVIAAVHGALA